MTLHASVVIFILILGAINSMPAQATEDNTTTSSLSNAIKIRADNQEVGIGDSIAIYCCSAQPSELRVRSDKLSRAFVCKVDSIEADTGDSNGHLVSFRRLDEYCCRFSIDRARESDAGSYGCYLTGSGDQHLQISVLPTRPSPTTVSTKDETIAPEIPKDVTVSAETVVESKDPAYKYGLFVGLPVVLVAVIVVIAVVLCRRSQCCQQLRRKYRVLPDGKSNDCRSAGIEANEARISGLPNCSEDERKSLNISYANNEDPECHLELHGVSSDGKILYKADIAVENLGQSASNIVVVQREQGNIRAQDMPFEPQTSIATAREWKGTGDHNNDVAFSTASHFNAPTRDIVVTSMENSQLDCKPPAAGHNNCGGIEAGHVESCEDLLTKPTADKSVKKNEDIDGDHYEYSTVKVQKPFCDQDEHSKVPVKCKMDKLKLQNSHDKQKIDLTVEHSKEIFECQMLHTTQMDDSENKLEKNRQDIEKLHSDKQRELEKKHEDEKKKINDLRCNLKTAKNKLERDLNLEKINLKKVKRYEVEAQYQRDEMKLQEENLAAQEEEMKSRHERELKIQQAEQEHKLKEVSRDESRERTRLSVTHNLTISQLELAYRKKLEILQADFKLEIGQIENRFFDEVDCAEGECGKGTLLPKGTVDPAKSLFNVDVRERAMGWRTSMDSGFQDGVRHGAEAQISTRSPDSRYSERTSPHSQGKKVGISPRNGMFPQDVRETNQTWASDKGSYCENLPQQLGLDTQMSISDGDKVVAQVDDARCDVTVDQSKTFTEETGLASPISEITSNGGDSGLPDKLDTLYNSTSSTNDISSGNFSQTNIMSSFESSLQAEDEKEVDLAKNRSTENRCQVQEIEDNQFCLKSDAETGSFSQDSGEHDSNSPKNRASSTNLTVATLEETSLALESTAP